MIYTSFQPVFSEYWYVFVGLALFGVAYDQLVAYVDRRGWADVIVSLEVAVGVFVTIATAGVLPITATAGAWFEITLTLFGCSGSPMIAGSLWRYLNRRERVRREIARAKE